METIDYAKVGLKMKELRNELGISQQTIASDIGATVAFISNIENNKVKMNLRMIVYYANMCNVPIDVLIDAGREQKRYSDNDAVDQQIIDTLKNFDTDSKKLILQMLQIAKKN
jgi:transcriptional regulator with XRE-family HTH domain